VTGAEIRRARGAIGHEAGLGRALMMVELGELLKLTGRDPGASVRDWERGHTPVSGPASVAIEALRDGWRPTGWRDVIRWDRKGKTRVA
jgi:hypothetical protein